MQAERMRIDIPGSPADFARRLADLEGRFAALKPELEVTVRDPALSVEGYVVVWNTGISIGGPLERSGKGGTRISPTVTLDEVSMLARVMALKNAAAGLPLGGAKSGLRADSAAPEFERRYRRFIRLCAPFLRENGGPFGGFGFDIGARPEQALWACDELGSTASFTGKPLAMGGTDYDREGIAGLGVAVAAATALEERGRSAGGAAFSVQGTGAMGAAVIRYFSAMGGRLAALGDPRLSGTWRLRAPPSDSLAAALAGQDLPTATRLLEGEAERVSDSGDDALWEIADVVFPCAVQNVLSEREVPSVRARIVCEGANSAITEAGHAALHGAGIDAVPDFVANAGGVIAAFVELTCGESDKVSAAKRLTRETIATNVRYLAELGRRCGCGARHAGLYLALARLFAD
jgi:glutamate dehydrogenase (NAD(P)+)